ncbi:MULTISPECIES: hypothetical protein [unclassified Paenibacillus]|uniref:hypothetical protein n=1 Tax=unclassified Paenibacillus TaxID=185978 RepID=UPI002788E2A5|nr:MULTISPECIES: hypothetical protein [unclassified Paenibacillus]MDQ0896184.1 hypothetical protein [Paenibacillus sp. V4I7]MDQ0914000.1 hypothetical protein [Paenibacillus sp. V4I5]
MGRSILILIFSMMLICVGCQSKQQINNDKLVVLKRSGTENKHEKHKEVTDKNTVLAIKSVLKKGDWKKSKISMTIPPVIKFISNLLMVVKHYLFGMMFGLRMNSRKFILRLKICTESFQ